MRKAERDTGRLLVIDDSVTFCRYFLPVLERYGYQVRLAHDPFKGLRTVLAEPVDLVLLERHLPGTDGLAVCRLLKKYPQTQGVGVVLLSHDDGVTSRVEGLRAGADDYLSKRISPDELDGRLQALLRAQQLWREVEAQRRELATVLESLSDAVLLVRVDGMAELANGAAQRLLGLDPDILRIRSVRQILGTLRFPAEVIDRLLGSAAPVHEEIAVNLEGREHTLLVHARRIEQPKSGLAVQGVMVMLDITERREYDRLKADFHSMIAHDLRSPLSVVQGYATLLLSGKPGPLNALQRDFLSGVQVKLAEMERLLNDFLDVSKLEAGFIVLQREAVQLRPLLERVRHDIALIAQDRGVQVELELSPALETLTVPCDPGRITQVLLNLLTNAVKYNRPNGRIAVQVKIDGADLLVEVKDEGPGIPPARQQAIFERYVRLQDGTDAPDGIGLGLMIVRKIVAAHGGRVGVVSTPGQGSTFWFRLPLESAPAGNPEEVERPASSLVPA